MKFGLEKAKELFRKDRTRFCEAEEIHAKLLEWMENNNFIEIQARAVWIVPHKYLKDKIAIRPYGLIFVSERVPERFLNVVVLHEIIEEELEPELGRDEAHRTAVIEEYRFLKEKKMLEECLEWIKEVSLDFYNERLKLWRRAGFQV